MTPDRTPFVHFTGVAQSDGEPEEAIRGEHLDGRQEAASSSISSASSTFFSQHFLSEPLSGNQVVGKLQ